MKIRITIVFIVIALAVIIGCDGKSGSSGTILKDDIVVKAAKPDVRDIEEYVEFSGRLEGVRDVMIFPQIPGTIDRIYVELGDKVPSGKLLVSMNDETLKQVRAQYDAAKQTFERMKILYNDSLIAPQSYDQAKAGFEAARAGYNKILENTELRAPFAGIIVGKYYDVDDVYSPGMRGILRLAVTDKLKLPVTLAGKDFGRVREGMLVKVTTEVAPDTVFDGTLKNISPGADPITGLFNAEIALDNSGNELPVGVYVQTKIIVLKHEDAIIIPRSAVITDSVVFVFDGGKVQRKVIQPGIFRADSVEILSGITADDIVVYDGALGLRDGAKVVVYKEVVR